MATDAEILAALIAKRKRKIGRYLGTHFVQPNYLFMKQDSTNRPGGLMLMRDETFGKVALHNNGAVLGVEAAWAIIQAELAIYPLNFIRKMSLLAWSGISTSSGTSANLTRRFYKVDKTSDLAVNFGWQPVLVPASTIPDFGSVTREEIYDWIGFTSSR